MMMIRSNLISSVLRRHVVVIFVILVILHLLIVLLQGFDFRSGCDPLALQPFLEFRALLSAMRGVVTVPTSAALARCPNCGPAMKDGILAVSMKSLRIESCAVDEIFLLMHSKSLKHSLRFHDTYAKKVKHPDRSCRGAASIVENNSRSLAKTES